MVERVLSIAVCTFDRAALLDYALRSFATTAARSSASFELLVVDNNSRDGTRAVAERWAARSPFPVRYLFEPTQGLSAARNRAVGEAAGGWIWYIDDDVLLSPGWLDGIVDGLDRFADASVLAGAVTLAFEPPVPAWLPAAALPYYGMTDFGNAPRRLAPTEYPVGANMGVRRAAFDDVGLFRDSLGRVGGSLRSCEESELVDRLRARGHTAAYLPDVEVRHRIGADRATMRWLRRRAYWGGISYVLTDGRAPGDGAGAAVGRALRAVRSVARGAVTRGIDRERQLDYAWQLGTARAHLAEAVRRARTRGRR